MKMIMAFVQRDEAPRVLEALIDAGYAVTFTDCRGGMLRQAQHALYIGGVQTEQVEEVLLIIKRHCRSLVQSTQAGDEQISSSTRRRASAVVGSAAVFVWDIERFEMY